MSGPRSTLRWQQIRAAILAQSTHCAMCGQPLWPEAPPRSRWASTVDHITPISKGGDPFDPTNLRPAHYGCNARLGARQQPQALTWARSRQW